MVSSQPVRGSAGGPAEAVARTLASLVPAAVEGILRDVAIVARSGQEGLEQIADHAGCAFIEGPNPGLALAEALQASRGSDVLLIRAGRIAEPGLPEELAAFLRDGGGQAVLREEPQTFLARLFPRMAPAAALIAPRERLIAISGGDFARMAGKLGRATTLRCRARTVD